MQRGGRMHAGRADHVVDEGQLVGDLAEGRDHISKQLAAASIRLEGPDRRKPGAQPVLKGFDRFAKVARLAGVRDQGRLMVEQVDVAGGSRHKQLHHPLRLGWIDAGSVWAGGRRAGSGSITLFGEHGGQGDGAEAAGGRGEPVAAGVVMGHGG